MGQFFILRSRKFVNWNSPVFLRRYFFICLTYTSNKCFFIIIRSAFPVHVDTMRLIMTQNLSTHTEPRSKLTIFLLLPRPFLLSLSPSPSGTSFQTSAHLSIQDGGVSARGSRQIRLPCMLKHRVQQEYNSLLVNALNHIFKSNLSLINFQMAAYKTGAFMRLKYYTPF